MSLSKFVPVAHMGHDAPWLQIKTMREVKERRAHIRAHKPKHERPLRLKLLRVIKTPLSPKLVKADAAWGRANAARDKAYAAWVKANAARDKAYAARDKADAAWDKAINSPAGVAFHKQVCGCAWTPVQPDILGQLDDVA